MCVCECWYCTVDYKVWLSLFQYEEWNAHDRLTRGYIKTKAAPPIFYLPAEHTPNTEELLIETNDKIEGTSFTCPYMSM